MKIRSWHVVLMGILFQIAVGFSMVLGALSGSDWGAFFLGFLGVVILIGSALGVIPLLLLMFQKTRKIGSTVSIAFGILGIVAQFGGVVGIFLIIGGILSWWKKI